MSVFSAPPVQQEASRRLGQKLLLTAELRDWKSVQQLLEAGADPSITSFRTARELLDILQEFPEPSRQRLLASWEGLGGRPKLQGPSPLSQAVQQDDINAVKMLIRYHANPDDALLLAIENDNVDFARLLLAGGGDWNARTVGNNSAIDLARYSGNRTLINLLEDAAQVPLHDRNLAQEPFAPGAMSPKYEVIPGTIGATPTRHLLWVSPHELLILHNAPRRFSLIDLTTGTTTDLPQLSERWLTQEQFAPDMLTTSPDGKWLLGFGGTKDHATWLATEIRGNSFQEWDRVSRPDTNIVVTRNPMIAWQDNRHWVELNEDSGSLIARIRTCGINDVKQLPLQTTQGYLDDFPSQLFAFHTPALGLIGGQVASTAAERIEDNYFVIYLSSVIPDTAMWQIKSLELRWSEATHPGSFERCVLSPDGAHLAWLNYFTKSEAEDILVTDSDGKNGQIVFEHLHSNRNWKAGRAEAPWNRSLEWTSAGDGLIFWRGENGENGLGLVRLAPEELK